MAKDDLQKRFESGITKILEKAAGGVPEDEKKNLQAASAAIAEKHVEPIRRIRRG